MKKGSGKYCWLRYPNCVIRCLSNLIKEKVAFFYLICSLERVLTKNPFFAAASVSGW